MTPDAAAPVPIGAGTPLKYLPKAIRVPEHPVRAILVGWLLAFPISIALSVVAASLFPEASPPSFKVDGFVTLFGLVVFAPVAETLIMGGVLLVLLLFLPPAAAVIVSAAGWGIAHSLMTPIWGLVIWWPFVIFSTLFVTWRTRSYWLAFAVPAATHALQNLIPALLIVQGVNI
ncbi:hypothetical protein H8M03_02660 [Sphingomonas sabuli]|uniref:CAAX prenyl protease 2/Lysostaphin resistance protein A-like domain-containing protein n=1 Tax=Sphingomonas sabuli TaxID=2764186 RepID=A0A7G9L3R8_9SPHN|nr:CPBP family glutamic-type intramembrane protease [Sphingomonas sabuli]QNM83267.1 hypothetical protein H8M03_02660 [Sphingomonas sabuli]